ncbi:MAG TPA: hypothetical protein PK878_02840 [bacterium]|nr:hypothetical protein [Candidatus Omnitrophota bacterium]HOJ59199.1 hypothetical protein [bacterium]HOL94491.1 hypothetical protein [bacterium]HPP00035.1 hypothetical protein [bacterium]HXK92350.1 hypothetical protein [bacterium]
MKRMLIGIVLVTGMGMVPGLDAAATDWAVGETWVYRHEGFRPFAPPGQTAEIPRTRKILSIQGEGAEKRWLLEERWGEGEGPAAVSFIDAAKGMDKVEMGENFSILFRPAIPVDWSGLKPGEEKKVESESRFNGNTSKIQYEAKRLEDENVTVPAGEFKNTTRVQVEMTMTFNTDQGSRTFKMLETYWYHPDANGFVKEQIEMVPLEGQDAPDQPMKGTSVLLSHTQEKKE